MNGFLYLTLLAGKLGKLLNGGVRDTLDFLVLPVIIVLNWIQMSHAGHYSVLVLNNVTGDSWFAINGYRGNNI